MLLIAAVLVAWLRDPLQAGEPGAELGPGLHLSSNVIALGGTRENLMVLERRNGDSSGAAVNILIVDADDASGRWMFPDNSQIILSRDTLYAGAAGSSPVTGLVLTVGDPGGTKGARQSLYSYRVGGGPAVRFLTADAILAAKQSGFDRYLVVYRNGGKAIAGTFSLADFKSLAQQPLPDVPR